MKRSMPLLLVFALGALVGYFQPVLIGKTGVPQVTRCFFGLQIGTAFVLLALFLRNYLQLRAKVHEKYGAKPEKSD